MLEIVYRAGNVYPRQLTTSISWCRNNNNNQQLNTVKTTTDIIACAEAKRGRQVNGEKIAGKAYRWPNCKAARQEKHVPPG